MFKFSKTNSDINNPFNKFNDISSVGGLTHPQEFGGISTIPIYTENFQNAKVSSVQNLRFLQILHLPKLNVLFY